MPPRKPSNQSKKVETIKHEESKRRNIPTAEHQSVMAEDEKSPIRVAYDRRNRDLDPQLVWRGKDEQDWSDLVVSAPPLYIQEKVHPKTIVDDLRRQSQERSEATQDTQLDLFADFNGLPKDATATEFYKHDANWTNRMILGDSLQVMASLAEREGLRGKVQCIYFDPPYGIKFNSNFQWSTTSRDVKDGKLDQITREPEQVKAFRDTWRDGIHSYLTYLRDRLTVARDLLTESGSIFVQIGDENVHLVRSLLDEIFGSDNFISNINFKSTNPLGAKLLPKAYDFILWYSKQKETLKFRSILKERDISGDKEYRFVEDIPSPIGRRRLSDDEFIVWQDQKLIYRRQKLTSSGFTPSCTYQFTLQGHKCSPFGRKSWATNTDGMERLQKADRLFLLSGSPYYKRYFGDAPTTQFDNTWTDQPAATESIYVVQTATKFIQRCIMMTTDPGDLVLDPTCGSGTTAYVAEQWGRRWITIDTSRVALALARARIMGARYPYYLLADSPEGQQKEAAITRTMPSDSPTHGNIRLGFVYDRVPHITLKSIANNTEIDTIWESHQTKLDPLREALNQELSKSWEEWEIPREVEAKWSDKAKQLHGDWWKNRIARQKEIDASIAAKADQEFLYDKPYEDKNTVRVAGPFTVESLSPHRVLAVDENDDLIDPDAKRDRDNEEIDFVNVILENLKTSGVQQAHKEDKINFTSLVPFPSEYICAEGRYVEGENDKEKRAGIFIGSEFGTVSRPDLVAAAREAGDIGFDVLIACAFNYDAHSAEFNKLGRIPILKARMNADLHMANDLKNTGAGNLFVIFGEPDIDINSLDDGKLQVKIHGVDVFHPQSGEVRSSNADEIACWFIDTDYNEESFFVRHAYFLGASDPYKSLKTTLKAEIDEEAWSSLYSDTSRPFAKPKSGRIAVKVINHLGDEVMKVFSVG
ncbi:site-specific DNA-methyltransferase [Phormidium tenue]|uniref:Site-specific DNA-methyltransferase n=1 Tax=Phormidium tenue FACHB-1050 TaxID=2692857 RepID=A0ABR8C8N0_9CYAN|nr:site-specific DNA-methyltransferase [Phormidium tenue]MBD2317049.1 site-specific DNA-methyltransferase [Phormidium tenue FACHB-1050]